MAERNLSAAWPGFGAVHHRLRLLLVGVLTGSVAGMGSFLFINSQFFPLGLGENWGLLIVGLAGAYTHFLAADLTESVKLSLIAFLVGICVHVGAAIAPLWILPYPPFARDYLLPQTIGRALAGNILGYLMTFWGAYFGAILASGYFDP